MNNKKYLLFLIFMGTFSTYSNNISAATKQSQCPHEGMPVESLSSDELKEVLTCKQAQTENIEQLIEKVQEEEVKNPNKKRVSLLSRMAQAPRCPHAMVPLKRLKQKDLEEVYAYTQTHQKDNVFMIELLERLIARSDDHAAVKQYKLQLADTHYESHHIEKAAAYYEDFAVLYPGSDEHEYVLYKALLCMFEVSLDADRDQTNTKKSIALVKEFLKHAKKADLIEEAKTILKNCHTRLYDHEVYVFKFYTKKKNFTAAQMRLDYIIKTFPETIEDLSNKAADLAKHLELTKNPAEPTKKAILNRFLA